MIDFRYHVVSIVAVFLALALGLFIGSTSLRGTVASDLNRRTAAVKSENGVLNGQINDLKGQLKDRNDFETALEPYAIGGALAGESVAVVSAPGVDGGTRSRVDDALTLAGATLTADVQIQNSMLDPQQSSFIDSLVSKFSLPGVSLSGSASQRALTLLARVLGTRPQARQQSSNAVGRVVSAFQAGNLIDVSGSSTRPGALTVLLVPSPSANADPAVVNQQQTLLLSFVSTLDKVSVGTVLAGPDDAADNGGLVDAARNDSSVSADVSTVAGTDNPTGVVATVLALAEQARGAAGAYGGAGGSAPVPTPPPS